MSKAKYSSVLIWMLNFTLLCKFKNLVRLFRASTEMIFADDVRTCFKKRLSYNYSLFYCSTMCIRLKPWIFKYYGQSRDGVETLWARVKMTPFGLCTPSFEGCNKFYNNNYQNCVHFFFHQVLEKVLGHGTPVSLTAREGKVHYWKSYKKYKNSKPIAFLKLSQFFNMLPMHQLLLWATWLADWIHVVIK